MSVTVITAATVMGLLVTVALDRVVGVVATSPAIIDGLIFHPHSTATYHTSEFNFTAVSNTLGFRDHEFSEARSAACRVIAIGDSFTFGWGVSLEESWPKVVESILRQAGVNVDVANLGFPGGSPVDYANIAARAVPVLKPDLVVVAVLQGDDLRQLRGRGSPSPVSWSGRIRQMLHRIEGMMYPHLTTMVHLAEESLHHRVSSLSVNTTWKEQAQAHLAGFNPAEKRRYEQVDAAIRHAFETGDLNPALVVSATRHPEYFLATFDLTSAETRALIKEMSTQLARIRTTVASARASTVVVSVPFGLYVSDAMFHMWQSRYGFDLDARMLTSNAADEAIRLAAEDAGLTAHTVIQAFRDRNAAPLYFELDGHLNAEGHRFYAEQVTPALVAALRALPRRCEH